MKKIYIIGLGGFATEVYYLINEINKVVPTYQIEGFINKNSEIDKIKIGDREYTVFEEDTFVNTNLNDKEINLALGIGNPQIINKISSIFSRFNFPNLVHPSVNGYFENIELGKGNIITAGCNFTINIQIGSFNIFNLNSTLGHDATIENCNVINPGTNISGGVKIGSNNLIGTGATILQNLSIGSYSILGAGSVLTKDLLDHKLAIGVPAQVIKDI